MEITNILKFRNNKYSVTIQDVICKIERSYYFGKIKLIWIIKTTIGNLSRQKFKEELKTHPGIRILKTSKSNLEFNII
jgi:hypothetical protein